MRAENCKLFKAFLGLLYTFPFSLLHLFSNLTVFNCVELLDRPWIIGCFTEFLKSPFYHLYPAFSKKLKDSHPDSSSQLSWLLKKGPSRPGPVVKLFYLTGSSLFCIFTQVIQWKCTVHSCTGAWSFKVPQACLPVLFFSGPVVSSPSILVGIVYESTILSPGGQTRTLSLCHFCNKEKGFS